MLISFHFIPFSVYSLKEVICTVKANLQVPPIQPFEGTPRINVGDTCTLLPATGHLDEVMAELRTQCGIPGTIYLHIQYFSIYIIYVDVILCKDQFFETLESRPKILMSHAKRCKKGITYYPKTPGRRSKESTGWDGLEKGPENLPVWFIQIGVYLYNDIFIHTCILYITVCICMYICM